MAKQTVNLGTMADNKSGDPLRTAFEKINENFDELYTSVGLDLTAISTDIIPDTDVAYDLGSPTNRFRDLYLSGNTIDLGGARISADSTGKIIIPGVNRKLMWPSSIADWRGGTEQEYYNPYPLWETGNPDNLQYVVIDQLFYQMIYHAAEWGLAITEYTPAYLFDASPEGYVTAIYIDGSDYPPQPSMVQVDYAGLNEDNMWIIPTVYHGQPVQLFDTAMLRAILEDEASGAQMLAAGVLSDFEASTPQINYSDLLDLPAIPQDVSELADAQGLLGGVTSYNDLTDKPTLFSGSYDDLTDKPSIPSVAGLASENYVDTQIADVVGAAPTTLNTLNELALALGDDVNFSTTIVTALGNKANTADLSSVALSGSYADLTNKPTLFSGSYADLTNKPTLFSGSYADLTNKPTIPSLTGYATEFYAQSVASNKQDALVSGTNIKTINGQSILGSGDITISGGTGGTTGGTITATSPADFLQGAFIYDQGASKIVIDTNPLNWTLANSLESILALSVGDTIDFVVNGSPMHRTLTINGAWTAGSGSNSEVQVLIDFPVDIGGYFFQVIEFTCDAAATSGSSSTVTDVLPASPYGSSGDVKGTIAYNRLQMEPYVFICVDDYDGINKNWIRISIDQSWN